MQIGFLLKQYVKSNDIGHVMGNDTGVVTQRDPDTVRGADVAFISYDRAPKGKLPEQYLDESPELVFEVLSPRNREQEVLAKTGELLEADVRYVCIVNPGDEEIGVFTKDSPKGRWLHGEMLLTFEDVLPGFAVPVREVFE